MHGDFTLINMLSFLNHESLIFYLSKLFGKKFSFLAVSDKDSLFKECSLLWRSISVLPKMVPERLRGGCQIVLTPGQLISVLTLKPCSKLQRKTQLQPWIWINILNYSSVIIVNFEYVILLTFVVNCIYNISYSFNIPSLIMTKIFWSNLSQQDLTWE